MKMRTVLALASLTVAISCGPLLGPVLAEESGQQACMQDAMSVCSAYIPDRERVATCLISNRSRISPACRTALTHYHPQTASAR
ncbi:MAG TPA: hypothetical protein VHX43_01525 [Xanthobacteraceae bacterium]|jgi:hypothetical protein|nr:hypothetical protein [Xanthobacteraceae bacterium]